MSLVVYGNPISTCTIPVLLTAAEVGIELDVRVVDFKKKEHKTSAYLEKQPFGSVPYLEDTTVSPPLVVYESRAIARYIALKAGGGQGLVPVPGGEDYLRKLALFEQAASIEHCSFEPYASGLAWEYIFKKIKGIGGPDPEMVTGYIANLSAKLDVYDKILSKQPYLAGDEYTLADLFHLAYGKCLFKIGKGELITSRPHVDAWFKRINERAATEKVYANIK